jgi:plastocyanin
MLRRIMAAAALGGATGLLLASGVLLAAPADSPSTVSIDNFTFTPASLTVKAGTTVTFINKDDIPHAIASSTNAFAKSKALDTDDRVSFTFTTTGTYKYFCYLHPHMVGSIVVEAAAGSAATQ